MHWLSRLESKFGHLAIPGLLRAIAALSSLCFVLVMIKPQFLGFLYLERNLIMNGEVWRLFTYIFIPSIGGLLPDWLSMAMYVWFLFWIGDGLDEAWGPFRLNVFFLVGMLGTTAAAFIAGIGTGGGILFMTVFLAFARFYPEAVIRIFFILPVKVKWLAWVDGALLMYYFIFGRNDIRLAILAGVLNYFIFFGREIFSDVQMQRQVATRRARFEREIRVGSEETMHLCKVCGRTEISTPELEFRVTADGDEYCVEHLPKKEVA